MLPCIPLPVQRILPPLLLHGCVLGRRGAATAPWPAGHCSRECSSIWCWCRCAGWGVHAAAPEPSEIWARLVLGQATWAVHRVEQQVTSLLMTTRIALVQGHADGKFGLHTVHTDRFHNLRAGVLG